MILFVRLLTGESCSVDAKPSDTIEAFKKSISAKVGYPFEQIKLIWKGKQLENNKTFDYYGVTDNSTIHTVLGLRGGGGSFTDVSQGHMSKGIMSDDAPEWRGVSDGLILCGICENISCKAYKEDVLVTQKFVNDYELIHAIEPCPICGQKVEITNCGFFNCQWKYHGSLEDGTIKETTWAQTAPKTCDFFNEEKCGKVRWNSLMISTRNNNKNSIKIVH